jgi:hypothetical protein
LASGRSSRLTTNGGPLLPPAISVIAAAAKKQEKHDDDQNGGHNFLQDPKFPGSFNWLANNCGTSFGNYLLAVRRGAVNGGLQAERRGTASSRLVWSVQRWPRREDEIDCVGDPGDLSLLRSRESCRPKAIGKVFRRQRFRLLGSLAYCPDPTLSFRGDWRSDGGGPMLIGGCSWGAPPFGQTSEDAAATDRGNAI